MYFSAISLILLISTYLYPVAVLDSSVVIRVGLPDFCNFHPFSSHNPTLHSAIQGDGKKQQGSNLPASKSFPSHLSHREKQTLSHSNLKSKILLLGHMRGRPASPRFFPLPSQVPTRCGPECRHLEMSQGQSGLHAFVTRTQGGCGY